jgi:hypothetical protein
MGQDERHCSSVKPHPVKFLYNRLFSNSSHPCGRLGSLRSLVDLSLKGYVSPKVDIIKFISHTLVSKRRWLYIFETTLSSTILKQKSKQRRMLSSLTTNTMGWRTIDCIEISPDVVLHWNNVFHLVPCNPTNRSK